MLSPRIRTTWVRGGMPSSRRSSWAGMMTSRYCSSYSSTSPYSRPSRSYSEPGRSLPSRSSSRARATGLIEVSTTAGRRRSAPPPQRHTWQPGHIRSARAISAEGGRAARQDPGVQVFAPRLGAVGGQCGEQAARRPARRRSAAAPRTSRAPGGADLPARSSSSSARRTVIRLTPASSASSACVGSMSPGSSLRSDISCTMYETTCCRAGRSRPPRVSPARPRRTGRLPPRSSTIADRQPLAARLATTATPARPPPACG